MPEVAAGLPILGGQREAELLGRCYGNSLALAHHHGARSVAYPSIRTGAYGYPIALAAPIAVRTVQEHLPRHPAIELVRFVCFIPADLEVYRRVLAGGSFRAGD